MELWMVYYDYLPSFPLISLSFCAVGQHSVPAMHQFYQQMLFEQTFPPVPHSVIPMRTTCCFFNVEIGIIGENSIKLFVSLGMIEVHEV